MYIPSEKTCRTLHVKAYLFAKDRSYRCIIGSSNLTMGGVVRNHEANVMYEAGHSDAFLADVIELFDQLWESPCSVRPAVDHTILDAYTRHFKDSELRRPSPRDQAVITGKWLKEVEKVLNESVNAPVLVANADIAYVLGLLAGKSSEREDGVFSISYVKGLYNANTPDEGFIYAAEVSDTRLDQADAIRRDVEGIVKRLQQTFKRLNTQDVVSVRKMGGDFSYRIDISFCPESGIYRAIKPHLDNWPRENDRLIPSLPKDLLDDRCRDQLLSFLRGYIDIRSRVAISDRAGTEGRLRVAISISSRAREFAQDLQRAMQDTLGLSSAGVNLLDGTSRGREHILRIDPVEIVKHIGSKQFVSISWKQMLVEDFAKYNEEHFGQ